MNTNKNAYEILDAIECERKTFELAGGKVTVLDLGVTNDAGKSKEIGLKVAEATMGGLSNVSLSEEDGREMIVVEIKENPAISTLACQMAGWRIKIDGKTALGSGPARIPAKQPKEIYEFLNYSEETDVAALALETNVLPTEETAKIILEKTGAKKVIVAAFRGDSEIGLMNVIARVVEMGFFALEQLKFEVKKITYGWGTAPLPKITKDVMFTSNDALIYGGVVKLKTEKWEEGLVEKVTSHASPTFGKPFKELFKEAGDFYKMDPKIFAPAEITVEDTTTGKTYHAGGIKKEIVDTLC
ncbi:methenyltetrahydromethanopterin cyclohydrolase [Candidatus Altiarchaeales archaeon WOR_SM1_SCG]|nr:methenyltetrahydromethanopterin cyclohydrolase [Candidatus Altiarchaeales archaeon WOR_SM1_SCG]